MELTVKETATKTDAKQVNGGGRTRNFRSNGANNNNDNNNNNSKKKNGGPTRNQQL